MSTNFEYSFPARVFEDHQEAIKRLVSKEKDLRTWVYSGAGVPNSDAQPQVGAHGREIVIEILEVEESRCHVVKTGDRVRISLSEDEAFSAGLRKGDHLLAVLHVTGGLLPTGQYEEGGTWTIEPVSPPKVVLEELREELIKYLSSLSEKDEKKIPKDLRKELLKMDVKGDPKSIVGWTFSGQEKEYPIYLYRVHPMADGKTATVSLNVYKYSAGRFHFCLFYEP